MGRETELSRALPESVRNFHRKNAVFEKDKIRGSVLILIRFLDWRAFFPKRKHFLRNEFFIEKSQFSENDAKVESQARKIFLNPSQLNIKAQPIFHMKYQSINKTTCFKSAFRSASKCSVEFLPPLCDFFGPCRDDKAMKCYMYKHCLSFFSCLSCKLIKDLPGHAIFLPLH